MNLKNINAANQNELQMKLANIGTGTAAPLTRGIVYLTAVDINSYSIEQNGKFYRVEVCQPVQKTWLDSNLNRNWAMLTEVLTEPKGGQFLLNVVFFNGRQESMGNVEIGVDEKIIETLKRKQIHCKDHNNVTDFVRDRCQIAIQGNNGSEEHYFIILSGRAANEEYKSEKEPQRKSKQNIPTDDEDNHKPDETHFSEEVAEAEIDNTPTKQPFCIIGDGLRIPVELRQMPGGKEILFATKFNLSSQQNERDGAYILVKGELAFSDYTKTGQVRSLVEATMNKLLQEEGSYLKIWDKYGEVEGDILLKKARAVGELHFTKSELTEKGRKYYFEKKSLSREVVQNLSGGSLDIVAQKPPYLSNLDMTWKEYEEYLLQEKTELQNNTKSGEPSLFVNIIDIDFNGYYIEVDNQIEVSVPSFFILSLAGDKKQVERRNTAREQILTGRSANPLLGLLIEEGVEIPKTKQRHKFDALSSFVKNKIFKNEPTYRQCEAIETALNTPDICLIQGPPGTGKTTVITAILERLNEEFDKTHSIRGSVLVSGFQHDAVENVIDRLRVNSLPPVKFGGRNNPAASEDRTAWHIENWCCEMTKRIREKNPQLKVSEHQHKLQELAKQYLLSPSQALVRSIAQWIINIPRELLDSQEVIDRANSILESLIQSAYRGNQDDLRCIYAIRVSETGFNDDGTERATDVLERFEETLTSAEQKILAAAMRWKHGEPLADILSGLRQIKKRLLDVFSERPLFTVATIREDVKELIVQTIDELEKKRSGDSKEDAVLLDFLNQLEFNPQRVRESIEDYNFVYAATVQQAAGKDIAKAKKTADDKTSIMYDTVVIDEAARVSPRDLMIPMTQAQNRIILVGDHRQLPHIVETAIIDKLCEQDDETIENTAAELLNPDTKLLLEKSMFEYLFHRLKKLEEKDGVQRTVTLDAQYRMHPVLGQFISREFYEPHGEKFDSPLDGKYFTQNLEGTNGRPLMWLNIASSQGKEVHPENSHSWERQAEIAMIAKRLKKWIDSEEGKDLNFGVISFYKAQTDLLIQEFADYGLATKNKGGQYEITPEYQMFGNNHKRFGEERLRIGTVDAFQGKEFDVVFLSMVRTSRPGFKEPINNTEIEKMQISMFGHLMSKNRLCVSMSRQKRLLVLVGDAELVSTQFAEKSVPEMYHFLELCKTEGVYQ